MVEDKSTMLMVKPTPRERFANIGDLIEKEIGPTQVVDKDCDNCKVGMMQSTEVLTTPDYLIVLICRWIYEYLTLDEIR